MESIDKLVAEFGEQRNCATISWGVVRGEELVYTGGYVHPGAAGLVQHDGAAPGPDTVYRIASMTKSFSSAATLVLRDDGVLRLDDRVADWAPELSGVAAPSGDGAPITIRHLLTMSAGLVTDDPWADRNLDLSPTRFDEIVDEPMVFARPTGDGYEYSNFGFALLGRVIERATGAPIRHHVDERLLSPLGMEASRWDPPTSDDGEVVAWMRPLRWYDDIGFARESAPLADGMIAPMGGIWSTVRDIARWVSFLDDGFPARDDPDSAIMRRSSRREMQTPHTLVRRGRLRGVPHTMSYGMGLRILDEEVEGASRPRRVVNHSGGFPGYGSNMRWVRGARLGVIALANTTYAPMTELTALILDEVIANEGEPTPLMVKPHYRTELDHLAERLIDLLNSSSDERPDEQHAQQHGAAQPDNPNPASQRRGWDTDVAAALFADNVEPDLDLDRRRLAAHAVTPLLLERTEVVNDGHLRLICASTKTDDTGHPVVDGKVTISVLIAPPTPLRIQSYSLRYRTTAP